MAIDTRHEKLNACRWITNGLLGGVLFCLLMVAACGTLPPPSQPLSSLVTPTDQRSSGSATAPSVTQIQPIHVMNAQSHLSSYPGGQMSMTVSTSPYALCFFGVAYGLGKLTSNVGVVPRTADAGGMVSWTWHVDSGAHTGSWPLTITAVLPDGARTSARVNVTVTLPPINVVGVQTNVQAFPRGNMNLTIATAPSTVCSLVVSFGPSRQSANWQQMSNTRGIASWTWHIDRSVPAGVWPMLVTILLADGESTSIRLSMKVL